MVVNREQEFLPETSYMEHLYAINMHMKNMTYVLPPIDMKKGDLTVIFFLIPAGSQYNATKVAERCYACGVLESAGCGTLTLHFNQKIPIRGGVRFLSYVPEAPGQVCRRVM